MNEVSLYAMDMCMSIQQEDQHSQEIPERGRSQSSGHES